MVSPPPTPVILSVERRIANTTALHPLVMADLIRHPRRPREGTNRVAATAVSAFCKEKSEKLAPQENILTFAERNGFVFHRNIRRIEQPPQHIYINTK